LFKKHGKKQEFYYNPKEYKISLYAVITCEKILIALNRQKSINFKFDKIKNTF